MSPGVDARTTDRVQRSPIRSSNGAPAPSTIGAKDKGDTNGGGALGDNLVANMELLNRSPGLSADNSGPYNVGYRPAKPELPPEARVKQEKNPFGGGLLTQLEFPEGYPQDVADQIRLEWANAQDVEDGRVFDLWENTAQGLASKYFVDSQPAKSERYSWKLKDPNLAAEALDHWLAGSEGTTVADCASALVAIQLQSLRQRLGDDKLFNKLVKESGAKFFIAPSPMDTPLKDYMSEIDLYKQEDKGTVGKRPLKKGDAVYFANHPNYSKLEPNGLWHGENAIYMGTDPEGRQLFSGFGMTSRTEEDFLEALVKHYNDVAVKHGQPEIGPATLVQAGGGLQTSYDSKVEGQRGSPKGLRLDEEKVSQKVASQKR